MTSATLSLLGRNPAPGTLPEPLASCVVSPGVGKGGALSLREAVLTVPGLLGAKSGMHQSPSAFAPLSM